MSPTETASFVRSYLADADDRIADMSRQSKAGNLAAVAGNAHALVSTAGSVGAMRVSQLARSIETASRGGDTDMTSMLVRNRPEILERHSGRRRI
jgi:HPt (histidine-containing phosphotransfer) domain-containing protein